MSFILLIGSKGRMSTVLQEILSAKGRPFRTHSRAGEAIKASELKSALGIIDFSLPEATPNILKLALEAHLPLVSGTTGWKAPDSPEKTFADASKKIPIVWDSNFSMGIERLCQICEGLAVRKPRSVKILDIHHQHKKDSPSGTALKIERRIRTAAPEVSIAIDSRREGEVFGIHRVTFAFESESLDVGHEASSRHIFAEGALRALEWVKNQKPGLYSMRDVLRES